MPKKIIVPNVESNKSDIILDASDIHFPEGYKQYWLNNSQWTLMDSCGRINISYMYNWAKAQDPKITNKKPVTWLVNKSTKELRANYQNLLGFDPVNTVKGGDRVSKSDQSENSHFGQRVGGNHQSQNSDFENLVNTNLQNPNLGFGQRVSDNSQSANSRSENMEDSNSQSANSRFENLVNISSNGNVQNYGTYMTDRMIMMYSAWVSFDFQCYILDIFAQNANNALSPSGLILSTDELHKENQEVNNRHNSFLENIDSVPVNLRAPDPILKSINEYVTWLRTDYNIDVSLVEFYKWLCYMGVFYKDVLRDGKEEFDLYQPKPQYTHDNPPLFRVLVVDAGGRDIVTTYVREAGHNAMIQDIVKAFPQIKPDTV